MKKYLFLLFLFASPIQASPFAKGNADNGNLIEQMVRCSGAIGATLTEQEKQDLAAHLNQTCYHFK
jgi:hypothetical protein